MIGIFKHYDNKETSCRIFECVVRNAPLISIDLIVETKGELFLLGKRKNPPAKGFFFVPGGRILKSERLELAFKRIVRAELNIPFSINEAKFLGVFEHFYNENFLGNENFGTHYIVLAYHIKLSHSINLKKLPQEQHEIYSLFKKSEILSNNMVHPYTKIYFKEVL